MSTQHPGAPAPETPWSTVAGNGRRRLLLIAGAVLAVLLVVGLLIATLGDDSAGGPLGPGGDQTDAERAGLDYMTAVVEEDFQRECELQSVDFRSEPTVGECAAAGEELRGKVLIEGPVTVEDSVDLGHGRGYGVVVEYNTYEGEREDKALQVIEEDGSWLINSGRPMDEETVEYARIQGLDPIAVALEFLDVKADD